MMQSHLRRRDLESRPSPFYAKLQMPDLLEMVQRDDLILLEGNYIYLSNQNVSELAPNLNRIFGPPN